MTKQTHAPIIDKHMVVFGQACKQFLSFSLRILEYGCVETTTMDTHGERFMHHQRLNYILEGHPYYMDGDQRIDLEPGCLVYLPPNAVLGIEENGEIERHLFINFELGALDARDDFYHFMDSLFPNRHVHDKDKNLLTIFETIQTVGEEGQLGTALEIQNLFENLFLHVVRLSKRYQGPYHENQATGGKTILQSAMTYINSNIHHSFQVREMAEVLNISENYLYKIFMKNTGKSPSEFISDLRIELACSSLKNPDLPIKVIASRLGYRSVAHFSNAFKLKIGMSPAAYRKKVSSDAFAQLIHSHQV